MRIIIVLFFMTSFLYAQEDSNIGFGANVGYKCPNSEAGFLIEFKLKKTIDFYSGFTYGKFNGFGYVLGTDIFTLKKEWQPFVGLAFNQQFGSAFSIGKHGINETYFKVNSCNSLIVSIGVRWIVRFDDKAKNGFMAFTPYICYRQNLVVNKVLYENGVLNIDAEKKINNRIGSGIGVGIKMLYFFNRKKH